MCAQPRPPAGGHRFDVVMRPAGPHLTISGALDMSTAARLTSLLDVLQKYRAPLTLDLTGVTFADCAGVDPIVQRCRSLPSRPAVVIEATSRAFRRPFELLGVACGPTVDVDGWDRADRAVLRPAGVGDAWTASER